MILGRRVLEGGCPPLLYRHAYWERSLLSYHVCSVCYPFGLHWLVRCIRRLWEWSFCFRVSAFEKKMEESFQAGRTEGIRRAREVKLAALLKWRPPEDREAT